MINIESFFDGIIIEERDVDLSEMEKSVEREEPSDKLYDFPLNQYSFLTYR